jgi:hypothetical protein
MERKKLFIFGATILIVLLLFWAVFENGWLQRFPSSMLNKIQEVEKSLEEKGVTTIASSYPKYENIGLEYYYKYDYCSDAIQRVSEKLGERVGITEKVKTKKIGRISEKLNLERGRVKENNNPNMPLVVLEGKAELYNPAGSYLGSENSFRAVIEGVAACSEKFLTYSICRYLKEPPALCSHFSFEHKRAYSQKLLPDDAVCYESCNIEYSHNGKLIAQYWRGPPCSRLKSYVEGESSVVRKQCYGKNSCTTREDDIGCCLPSQCVNEGKCYDVMAALDVDSDGQKEVCSQIDGSGFWVNADMGREACNANFEWFECVGDECKSAVDNYDRKGNGLCCGDDKNEVVRMCEEKGKVGICDRGDDKACCSESSCVYNGKCYKEECTKIVKKGEKVAAYCSNGKWVDLDDEHCATCLGKNAWSGSICCGDDEREGRYPIKFSFDKGGDNMQLYEYCVEEKGSCVFAGSDTEFSEGCYYFSNNTYFEGGYYCSKNEWYDLDNNDGFCKKCGYKWVDGCCGDDKNEHYIKGEDGTFACCRTETDVVVNGRCQSTLTCGNNGLESGEQCEPPTSKDNPLCQQSTTKCFGAKLGKRDSFGDCDFGCSCSEDEFEVACMKGVCGAECGTDSDCKDSEICDQSTCSCIEKTYCGDGIVQERNDDGWKEECELPTTLSNPYCNETLVCFGTKSGLRYGYGDCDSKCQCSYEPPKKVCIKGLCGAECNEDGTGCSAGFSCNTESCTCVSTGVVCGNGVCEDGEDYSCPQDCLNECPYRISIEFDKTSYHINDTLHMKVHVYDKNNSPMPNAKFNLEVIRNNYIDTRTYLTSQSGYYEKKVGIKSKLQRGESGYRMYIAKTDMPQCEVVSDSAVIFVYSSAREQRAFNLSKRAFKVFNASSYGSECGNALIEAGELCEGSNVCRASAGCDYEKRSYDIPEFCDDCQCPLDLKSDSDSELYCNNCPEHCGDGIVNCGEECEAGDTKTEDFCRGGKLYKKIDSCNECVWYDDGKENDILISDCFCECPESPGTCIDGNWIEYRESYAAGCSGSACNECNCEDVYAKDTNRDGIEDKCSPEICNNGIDDNDNGLIDMDDPDCGVCRNCGLGTYNICDRSECLTFSQACYFNEVLFGYGDCYECSHDTRCEDYENDEVSCKDDTCSLGKCYWDGSKCCTDSDNDSLCDSTDNCPYVKNPLQQDSDKDLRGDACDICINEPLLTEPEEQKELSCNDNIDNDCDGAVDCQDEDCIGIDDCCQNSLDCRQSNCTIEKCYMGKCVYEKRKLCDNTECSNGYSCSRDGTCVIDEMIGCCTGNNCVGSNTSYNTNFGNVI